MKNKLVPLEDAMNFQIYKLATLLSRELGRALKTYRLTPEKWQILATLWQMDRGISQTEISKITLKDKPSVSRLVQGMISDGWIARSEDPEDSRAYKVHQTSKAAKHRDEIISALYSHFDRFFVELTSSEKNALLKLTKKYVGIIESRSCPLAAQFSTN